MFFRDAPIQRKLMTALLVTSGTVILLTCMAFVAYEFITLRKGMLDGYGTRAKILAANSTGALAFSNAADAAEVLAALKSDPRIVAACIYDDQGRLFAKYPVDASDRIFPSASGTSGYRDGNLEIFAPVIQGERNFGTIFLRSNLSALTDRYRAFAWLAGTITIGSIFVAFLLSSLLQRQVSGPILALAGTVQTITRNREFSIRARKQSEDELGILTDSFNRMLDEIHAREQALAASEAKFRALIENSADGIAVSDDQGKALYVSPALARMLGIAGEDLTGLSRRDLVHPEDLNHVVAKMEETLKSPGRVVQARYRLKHHDGSWRWIEMTATNLLGNPAVGGIVRNIRDITDQKRAEELIRSRDVFQASVEAIKDYAVLVLDVQGRIMSWNKGAEILKGYKAAEVLGKSVDVFYTPEDRARGHAAELLAAAIQKGQVEEEGWRVRKDGSRFLAEVALTAVLDDAGDLMGFVKVARDITERKKMEDEIRQSNAFLHSVLENVPNMIFVKDAKELRFAMFNKAGEELLGFQKNDLLGKNDLDLFPREQAEFFTAKDREVIAGGKLVDIPEEPIDTKDKGKRLLHTKKIPIYDKNGKPLFLLGISEDITDTKAAQRIIQEKTQLLDLVLRNIGDGVVASDEKGNFVVFNPAAEGIAGIKPTGAEPGGVERFGSFLPDGTTPFPEDQIPLVRALKGESTDNVEMFLRNRGNPKGIFVRVSGRPLRDEKGTIRGGMVIERDVTEERRKIERETYTRALEVSNKELQDFVFVASHDLQEPLRKIQSFGEFLQREEGHKLGEDGRGYLDRMRNAAGRMQRLINDLLALTRVTTKAQPFVPVALDKVLGEVLGDLEARIQETGAKVEPGPLPMIQADPTQMRQLFQNLIGNALKFHRPGVPPTVRITGNLKKSPVFGEEFCRITIEDNGIGFDNQYAEQIFKVFERLHGKDAYEGTGIGLSICRKVVERHGGKIWAEGDPGQGSRFIWEIPVRGRT